MSARRASQVYFVNGWTICSWFGDLLEAVAAGAAGLVGAIGVDHDRGLLLERVDHLADGIGHADHRGLHDDRRLARRLDVAGGHGGAGSFMRREDVFELRAVDQRLVERRILARGIAEHVFHAGGDELVGKGRAAGALERTGPMPATRLAGCRCGSRSGRG